ncbi:MAG: hypothetical protein O2909_09410 [Chloroflexi bacterium]|nr:hypothetical protein [Chloroflexota bacterium]MDA1219643.1 hypothetical protein [Chloroflexota bacterium]
MIEKFLANIFLDHPLWSIAAVADIVVAPVAIVVVFNKLIIPIILKLAQWLPSSGNGPRFG